MVNVLIVDDEAQNIDVIVERIKYIPEISEWRIYTAVSDKDARSIIEHMYGRGESLDLLLTDLIMENDNSGISLIKFINEIDPRVMSILFTASDSIVDRHSIFEIGAFEIVEKNKISASPVGEIINKARKAVMMKQKIAQANDLSGFIDQSLVGQIIKGDKLGARLKKMVIVFWDIRGFSRLCEILKSYPHLIASFLTEYNALAVEIVSSNEGIIDKFIGDGVMAIFGWKEGAEIEQAAYKSIKTCISLKIAFSELVSKYIKIWSKEVAEQIEISLGSGVHIGDVLFGEFGSPIRRNVTAIGSPVNLAARIESRSSDGDILISSTVKAYCDDLIFCSEAMNIDDIKNINGSFKIFKVDGLKV